MKSLLMRKVGGGLWPADPKAKDELGRIKGGEFVAVKVLRGRSYKQNALYWKVLERVVAVTKKWRSPEELHEALKVACGHVETVRLVDGRTIKVPASIAFAAIDQDEAQLYYEKAFAEICKIMGVLTIEEVLERADLVAA